MKTDRHILCGMLIALVHIAKGTTSAGGIRMSRMN